MSEETKNHTTIVKESSGGAGWFIAIILLVALGFGGWYLYNNTQPNDTSLDINVSVPENITE